MPMSTTSFAILFWQGLGALKNETAIYLWYLSLFRVRPGLSPQVFVFTYELLVRAAYRGTMFRFNSASPRGRTISASRSRATALVANSVCTMAILSFHLLFDLVLCLGLTNLNINLIGGSGSFGLLHEGMGCAGANTLTEKGNDQSLQYRFTPSSEYVTFDQCEQACLKNPACAATGLIECV